jgi:hypothetical protein
MTRYLLNVMQPDGDPPPAEVLEPIMRDIAKLNEEMKRAGAWVFSGGLFPPETATVVRVTDGRTMMTDGPYIEGKEHVGGFTIIEAPDLDAALEWARRAAETITLPIEVRPFREDHPS